MYLKKKFKEEDCLEIVFFCVGICFAITSAFYCALQDAFENNATLFCCVLFCFPIANAFLFIYEINLCNF